MFIALTGTPGTGKTSIAEILQEKGFTVIDLHKIAIDEHVTEGIDKERNSIILDPFRLDVLVKEVYNPSDTIIFEGHIAHLLSCMDKAIVLRCRPDILKKRLGDKRWKKEKIRENLEAEIIDIILCESVELQGESNVFEIDTTDFTAEEIAENIILWFKTGFSLSGEYKVGHIDWSEFLSEEFIGGV